MRKTTWPLAIALTGAGLVGSASGAQETAEAIVTEATGPGLFKSYCASCHGAAAKGDGPLANSLRYHPADLTTIAKRNQGRFEKDKVHRMIDGRDPIRGHGGPDMPLWGDAFKRSGDGYDEAAVKARIDRLVDFLEGLQVK